MIRLTLFSLISAMGIIASCLLQGCETPKTANGNEPRQSAIPWNRPEKWEGPGIMGNNMPGVGY